MTTAEAIHVFAPAKINLFLHVGAKRDDGFHALQSLVVFADVGDELAFDRASELSLTINGPFAAGLAADPDNLVLKAARLLGVGGRIALTKNLPVASGIGGGSADAAAALRGLARLWNLKVDERQLLAHAASVGSDVPVCLASAPAWMEGRGEVVTSAGSVPPLPLVLVNPGVPVATADVFQALDARRGTALHKPAALPDKAALLQFLATTTNDLEIPARAVQPVIGDVLESLASQPGVLLTRMCGSGATCFAVLESEDASANAAKSIAARRSGWWVRAARIAPADIGAPQ